MQRKTLIYLPLLLAGAAIPIAGAAAFADALGPSIMATAGQPPQQTGAIEGTQVGARDDGPATANSPTAPAMPDDPSYHGAPYVGALTAPPAGAMDKSYPSCSSSVQDECRNRDAR
ncbi:MAG: hypothetical protein KGJ57_08705 [Sphingomonadales bacterium]|nr:hypothetical protein [Sphingomonadales bacterium]MDE2169490.1 hypothetical protein [Sphingomonadales bacterium]